MDRFYLKEGNYLVLSVSDTGTGIEKDMLQYIYEPFFTTKEKGKGTGLGLATVYAIIKQNGGHINVYSETGQGTVFKIYLPLIDAQHVSDQSAEEISIQTIQGTETLLIVEDEESVLEYISESLAEYGYQIMGAINPVEAINIYRKRKSHIDMIISDVIMPQMSGPEMARKLRVDAPELKVLFMSGYTESMIGKHGVLDQELHYIQKPFGPTEIARKIRTTLDQTVKAYT
jgi:CheY-like chemotaxis protein